MIKPRTVLAIFSLLLSLVVARAATSQQFEFLGSLGQIYPDGSGYRYRLHVEPTGEIYAVRGTSTDGATVFHLSSNAQWHAYLVHFDGRSSTDFHSGLTKAGDGLLYGAMSGGFYSIFGNDTLSGFSIVKAFADVTGLGNGRNFKGELFKGSDGDLYLLSTVQATGTASSTTYLHRLGVMDGVHQTKVLFSGNIVSSQQAPDSSLIAIANGGEFNQPTAVKVNLNGIWNPLFVMDGITIPRASYLSQGYDGNIYGVTCGPSGGIFRVTTQGTYTLFPFPPEQPYGCPSIPLTLGPDGAFYSETQSQGGYLIRFHPLQGYSLIQDLGYYIDSYTPIILGEDGWLYGWYGSTSGSNTLYRYKPATALPTPTATPRPTATSTPTPIPTIASPSSLSATSAAPGAARLQWTDNSSNESGFALEISRDGSRTFSVLVQVGSNVTEHVSTGLLPGGFYYYRVKAFGPLGQSSYSNVATYTEPRATPTPGSPTPTPIATPTPSRTPTPAPTIAGAPLAPSLLSAASAGTRLVRLTWQDNSNNETGFTLERSINGSAFQTLVGFSAGVTQYTNSGVTSGITYSYRIRSYNAAGRSAYSNITTYTVP